MPSGAQDLRDSVASLLWDALDRLRVQAAAILAALPPQPGLEGTVLDGRLLATIKAEDIPAVDPATKTLIDRLATLVPGGAAAAGGVRLHGFDPGGGQPRGLAVAVETPQATVVAAVTGGGPSGLAFEIAAVGAGPIAPSLFNLGAGFSLELSGEIAGGARLELPRGAAGRILDIGAPVRIMWALKRDPLEPAMVGPENGPHFSVGSIRFQAATSTTPAGEPFVGFELSLPGAKLELAPAFLTSLFGSAFSPTLDLSFVSDPERGLSFHSGGVRATVPADAGVAGIDLRAVEIVLASDPGGLSLGFGLAVGGKPGGLPLAMAVEGMGAMFPILAGATGLGIDAGAVRPLFPSAVGIDLELPLLAGGGFLMSTGPNSYGGVLDLNLGLVRVEAIGVLELAHDGRPLSFAGIISVQFPLPGIQVGFGFSLNAVGGIVAIHRRLDESALRAAVSSGSANQLMFPADPAANAPAIVTTLGRVFPVFEGHLVIGPMLQIGWGGRLLTLSVALIVDMPDPVRFALLGRLALALPDPAVPLVLIQAMVVGTFEISPVPTTMVFASLAGSHIGGIPLRGEFLLLVRGGPDPVFVLSAGGFHPRYVRPRGIPPLQRLAMDLTPPGFPGMRCESYVAITSNSIQFGAHLELSAQIAGCGLYGWFHFDALFQWDPSFLFSVRCGAGLAIQVLGTTLLGISFDLLVEGPAPWHVRGTGSVELFLFSASLDFDVTWGTAPTALPPTPDVFAVLAAALSNPAAWVGDPPQDIQALVRVSANSNRDGGSQFVHPLGRLTVRQRAVPFDIGISRYQNRPVPRQIWTLAGAQLSDGAPVARGEPTQDYFAVGEFVELTETEKLTKPAYESFNSGAVLTPVGTIAGELRAVNMDFEVVLIPEIRVGPIPSLFTSAAAEACLQVRDLHMHGRYWQSVTLKPVVVQTSQPLAAASTETLRAVEFESLPAGLTAARQAAESRFGVLGIKSGVQIVERWELSS